MSYIKSVFLMSNKAVFDVSKLDTDSYAKSLGLAVPPRVRFLQKREKLKKERDLKKVDKRTEELLEQLGVTKDDTRDVTMETEERDDGSEEEEEEEDSSESEEEEDGKPCNIINL